MEIPLELAFRNVDPIKSLKETIRKKVAKLDRYHGHITGVRVAVERPHRTIGRGAPYRVRIDMTVPPGHELVVVKEPSARTANDTVHQVLNSAFEAAQRQLAQLKQRQRKIVKHHDVPAAFVVRKFDREGYGFLKTPEGREIYFHENSVTGGGFAKLDIGTQVRFEETEGHMGPQATTVHVIDKPGHRPLAEVEGDEDVAPPMDWRASERPPPPTSHA